MEDAPGKPDPTGLLQTADLLDKSDLAASVIYVGDTVADIYTVENARQQQTSRIWIGVGVLPPHVQHSVEQRTAYTAKLQKAGARVVLDNIEKLTPARIRELATVKRL